MVAFTHAGPINLPIMIIEFSREPSNSPITVCIFIANSVNVRMNLNVGILKSLGLQCYYIHMSIMYSD